jgi:Hemerythrin HHE cation binding domain
MQDIVTLFDDHDRLDGLAVQLAEIVKATAADSTGAFLLLCELSADLAAHLADEDAAIFAQSLERPADVVRFECEFADLTGAWALYLREWSMENIVADWSGFATETAWMMQRLRARIAQENALLYPLALQRGTIRLKAA